VAALSGDSRIALLSSGRIVIFVILSERCASRRAPDRMGAAPKNYYVYVLASISRTLYVGVTNDLERRVAEHSRPEL